MNDKTVELRGHLLNICFSNKEDLDFSDIGTCYLTEKGLEKILNALIDHELVFAPKIQKINR
jgi:hypothetical protein